jgi:hypothetical protein
MKVANGPTAPAPLDATEAEPPGTLATDVDFILLSMYR